MFGDRPAANLMTIAVKRASESYPDVQKLKIDSDELIINQGIIKGELKYVAGKAIYYFLGIPFAKAPMGDQRFKPPTEHPGWQVSLCQCVTIYCFRVNFYIRRIQCLSFQWNY